jgi:hypothetical protein
MDSRIFVKIKPMKSILLIVSFLLASIGISAQSAYVNGIPLAIVNTVTVALDDSISVNGYAPSIASSTNGDKLYVSTFFDTYIIDLATNTIEDSIEGFSPRYMAGEDASVMYGVEGNQFYTLDVSDHSIDSITLPGSDRIINRPNNDEIWVTTDSVVHVIDVSSGASLSTTFTTGSSQYDGSTMRFNGDGDLGIKMNWNSKTLAKIDAENKTVDATMDLSHLPSLSGVEVSEDGAEAFVTSSNNNTIYKVDVETMTLTDSAKLPNPLFGLYRHPSSGKLWVVGHFDNVLYVVNPTDLSLEDSVLVPGDPHIVEFVRTPAGFEGVNTTGRFEVFPNPAHNLISVQASAVIGDWTLYDISGRAVKTGNSKNTITSIPVSELKSGAYMLVAGTHHRKIIVD